jgi:hypothetical protein
MSASLPSFFVIGAQKAGTTSLHTWLSQQPGVCLPKVKETHFFSDTEFYNRGQTWYQSQFTCSPAENIVGEMDPEYLYSREAPKRIKQMIPAPKFIVIFRSPLQRAYSHYLMTCRRGLESLSFRDALLAEGQRKRQDVPYYHMHHSYFGRSRYTEQIEHYKAIFPDAPFLYVKFDTLVSPETGPEHYRQICQFIGLQAEPVLPDFSDKRNRASESRSAFVRDLIYRASPIKKVLAFFIRSEELKLKIAQTADTLNLKPVKNRDTGWLSTVPEAIVEEARAECEALQTRTGLDLSDWIHSL